MLILVFVLYISLDSVLLLEVNIMPVTKTSPTISTYLKA